MTQPTLVKLLTKAQYHQFCQMNPWWPNALREQWFSKHTYALEIFGALSYVKNRGAHPERDAVVARLAEARRPVVALLEEDLPLEAKAFLLDLLLLDAALIHGGLDGRFVGTSPDSSEGS